MIEPGSFAGSHAIISFENDGSSLLVANNVNRVASCMRSQFIMESDGNHLINRPYQPRLLTRVTLVQEGNRLVVRRDTGGLQERHGQQDSNELVSPIIPQYPMRIDDQWYPCISSEKLSVMFSLHTLSDQERDDLIHGDQSCAMCLEDYRSPKVSLIRLPCGHIFHDTCIFQWVSATRRSCPICRQMLLKV